jgi:hypothetical protein
MTCHQLDAKKGTFGRVVDTKAAFGTGTIEAWPVSKAPFGPPTTAKATLGKTR